MFLKVGVPLIIVALLALILLVWVLIYHRRRKEVEEEKDLYAAMDWTGVCPSINPDTGARCQREEFHTTNHYVVTTNDMMKHWF